MLVSTARARRVAEMVCERIGPVGLGVSCDAAGTDKRFCGEGTAELCCELAAEVLADDTCENEAAARAICSAVMLASCVPTWTKLEGLDMSEVERRSFDARLPRRASVRRREPRLRSDPPRRNPSCGCRVSNTSGESSLGE